MQNGLPSSPTLRSGLLLMKGKGAKTAKKKGFESYFHMSYLHLSDNER
jgi:hypothetical protein